MVLIFSFFGLFAIILLIIGIKYQYKFNKKLEKNINYYNDELKEFRFQTCLVLRECAKNNEKDDTIKYD